MGMPIEEAAMEVVNNNADLNIHEGRIAAYRALMRYLAGLDPSDRDFIESYVPDLPEGDQRLDDVALTQYNSVRNAWCAMYEHWKYPDLFVVVQGDKGSVYTQVNKHVMRASDHSQATLW